LSLPLFKKRILHTDDKPEMSFVDHLEVLRWHIVRSVVVIFSLAIIIFLNIDWLFDHIIYGPMRDDFASYKALCSFGRWLHLGDVLCMPAPHVDMQANKFGSQFMGALGIAFMGGFIVGFPYILYEIWKFIKPALNPVEIKSAKFGIVWVSFFFALGIAFAYFLIAPFTFSFLANYHLGTMNAIVTRPTFDDYIDNMTNIIIGTGLSFELPVVSYVLTRIGLITPKFLKDYRRYAFVFILIIAAIITPSPDWTSQLIVAIPLVLLYEISILISHRVMKENLKREQEFFSS
jgi:sec-independent protein translocase protein TatC